MQSEERAFCSCSKQWMRGKDSAVKTLFSGLIPQVVHLYSFKQPSEEELLHDYIWRTSNKIAPRLITI
jgi:polyphosphate kinase 2 (PPK2 family)